MPTTTYTPIASVTLSASASEVVFSGLPQTYRDLILVANVSGTVNDAGVRMRFNGDSGSNYSTVAMGGSGAVGTYSFSTTTTHALFYAIQIGVNTNGIHTPVIGQIMDYSATDKHKTLLSRVNGQNNSTTETAALASRWANTSAITSISLTLASGSFASGCTFNLFGIVS